VLHGRRYNEGMHQAIEAKEGVEIQAENQTLATITLQNYFRLYKKLAGMTGTAQTEASELHQIYKLGVVSIPTNRPMIREDQPDLIYKTEAAKFEAVADDISQSYDRGQPVLVGTTSVEKSEYLAKLLLARGVPHEVLNAKHHEREAIIVARAGHAGSVTVSTNMAGRGTDIMLGGNPEFMADEELRSRGLDPVETPQEYEAAWEQALAEAREQVAAEAEEVKHAGGLYVLGTERHESRRIDNQLRGRSGRQGDPGESRFYLSLGDELMRRFNGQLVESIMNRFNLPDDVPIEAGMVTKAIKSAQTQVEQQNFEIRKNVLKYDEVMNKQRMVIYEERRRVLAGEDLQDQIQHMLADVAEAYVDGATATGFAEDWDLDALWTALGTLYPVGIRWQDLSGGEDTNDITREVLAEAVIADIRRAYAEREAEIEQLIGPQGGMRELERQVLLQVLDRKWREHLYEMDYLKEGIGLRAMAQRDPLIEYQREGFDMFSAMLDGLKEETTGHLFNVKVEPVEQPAAPAPVEASQPVEAIEAAPARTKARQRADAQGRAGGRGSTRPAGRHSRAEEPPTQVLPVLGAAGVGSDAPADLRYTGPTEDGTAARMHAGAGPDASGNGGAGGNGGGSGGGNSGRNGGGSASGKAGGNGNRGAARGSAGLAAAGTQGGAAQGGAAQGGMAQGGAEPSRNRPCPCGSGRKYKHCHGSPTGARS
jgi:preprotein translocase subunit SecA